MILGRKFFDRDTLAVAEDLLGRKLFVATPAGAEYGFVTETEAYCGTKDLACHASKGRTKRTEVMFGPPGHAYVYMIYGMYFCLNLVTEKEGNACAVLIRGVELPCGTKLDGPGKLCRHFGITKEMNGADLTDGCSIWIDGAGRKKAVFTTGPRVGVDYAGEWKDKPFRFRVSGWSRRGVIK